MEQNSNSSACNSPQTSFNNYSPSDSPLINQINDQVINLFIINNFLLIN